MKQRQLLAIIRSITSHALLLCCSSVLTACSLSDLVNQTDLPSTVIDPKGVQTREGALEMYQTTLLRFADAVGGASRDQSLDTRSVFTVVTGLITDELTSQADVNGFPSGFLRLLDVRNLLENDQILERPVPYQDLNQVRGLAQETRGMLRKYAIGTPSDLIGHMFAIEGMVAIMFSEIYCSGIPLSTVDFEANYTLTRGFSTAEVYQKALALFDSADIYITDSARIRNFVQLARARALLGQGNIESARAAIAGVPSTFQYLLTYDVTRPKFIPNELVYLGNREGENGLAFNNGSDPRTTLESLTDLTAPLVLSSGVEARLIEAEAALRARQGNWLTILNTLRTTCTMTEGCPNPVPPGEGGVAGLPPLADPSAGASLSDSVANEARLSLVFDERGYWLLLSGHRQGDLRRLVRTYHRQQQTVYPTGRWGTLTGYGNDVTLPLPPREQTHNPLYEGCLNRDA